MTERNFTEALRQADRTFEEDGMPAAVDQRLRRRLRAQEAPAASPWIWRGALAAAIAAAAIILVLRVTGDTASPPKRLGTLRLLAQSSDLATSVSADGTVTIRQGSCTVAVPSGGGSVQVLSPGSLRPEPRGLRVVRGKVMVKALRRAPGRAPLRVLVSHGTIEVMGTRFVVHQREQGGEAHLEEGAIRFVARDGRTRVLAPGESLAWPLPSRRAEPPPPAEEPDPTPEPDPEPKARPRRRPRKPSPPEPQRLALLLERVAELRSRARYSRAAKTLRRSLGRRWSAGNRERLSFELGSILTYHLGDRAQACRWWAGHRRRYGEGIYATEIAQAEAQARCATAEEEEP